MVERYFAGMDIGSVTAKTVIVNGGNRILSHSIVEEGIVNEEAGLLSFNEALKSAGLARDRIELVNTTGYGRDIIGFRDLSTTEISCHAAGAYFLSSDVRTVIDIGGQDSKVISLDDSGRIMNFQMNDKCAAGTGRFLEVMARALNLSMSEMGSLGSDFDKTCHVSSMCTVFAESEIISLAAKGFSKENIIAGLYESIARRTSSMLSAIGVAPKVTMTGGVAKNPQLVKALERTIKERIEVSSEPQIVGALGAALLAKRQAEKR